MTALALLERPDVAWPAILLVEQEKCVAGGLPRDFLGHEECTDMLVAGEREVQPAANELLLRRLANPDDSLVSHRQSPNRLLLRSQFETIFRYRRSATNERGKRAPFLRDAKDLAQ